MEYDQESGLMHMTDEERCFLKEERSPIDYRVAPYLLPSVLEAAAATTFELNTIYASSSVVGTKMMREEDIIRLRKHSELLESIKICLSSAALDVELRYSL